MNKIIRSICFLFLVAPASAQNIDFTKANFPDRPEELKSAMKSYQKGVRLLAKDEGDFREANSEFYKAYAFNPSNALLCFYMGVCHAELKEGASAIASLLKAKDLDSTVASNLDLYLGRAYHLNMQWDTALYYYNACLKKIPPGNLEDSDVLRKYQQECLKGQELGTSRPNLKVDNLGSDVNSEFEDYTPIIAPDESRLFFTSRRPGILNPVVKQTLPKLNEDIFIAAHRDSHWTAAVNADSKINTGFHEAVCGIHKKGQVLLVFKGDIQSGDLFYVEYKDDRWGELEDFGPAVNTAFHESSASISANGKTMVFVSDKPGGAGGRDLYVSYMNDSTNTWGPAVNLGAGINTKYEEEGVFLHPTDNALYFSSNGPLSMGGYDLFKAEFVDGTWSSPVNLGLPVNSAADEVFVSLPADGKSIYFSSDREGGRGYKDIYVAQQRSVETIKDSVATIESLAKDSSMTESLHTVKPTLRPENTKATDRTVEPDAGKSVAPKPATVRYTNGYYFEVKNVKKRSANP